MKVKKVWPRDKPSYGAIYCVYSFYVIENKKYYVVSPDDYDGLLVLTEEEVEVVDPVLGELYMPYSTNISCGYKHQILVDDVFYDGLLENDSDSYKIFLERLNGKKN